MLPSPVRLRVTDSAGRWAWVLLQCRRAGRRCLGRKAAAPRPGGFAFKFSDCQSETMTAASAAWRRRAVYASPPPAPAAGSGAVVTVTRAGTDDDVQVFKFTR